MAESPSPASSLPQAPAPAPALPSTADTTPYVPVSWAAAAAFAVAGLFVLVMLALGLSAFVNKKPLIMEPLLAFPVVTLVLCFAARRMIINSEGTRTGVLYGLDLVNAAWWTALVVGLCYVAYLFAIDFAIQRDAKGEVEKWMGQVKSGEPDSVTQAFYRTLPPGARQGIAANDTTAIRGRFRDDLLMFANGDLMRMAQRNPGELNFKADSVTWANKPGSIDCVLNGTVTCPEGTFPVVIAVKGFEGVTATAEGGGGGRQWMIERPRGGGFVDQSRAARTPYGWLLLILEKSGAGYANNFVSLLKYGPPAQPYLVRAFAGGDTQRWIDVATDPSGLSQLGFAIPAAVAGPFPYRDYMENKFFRLPGGGEPSAVQKEEFFKSWNAQGLRPAGDKLKGQDGSPIDKDEIVTLTDRAVEVRAPAEIPIQSTAGKVEIARAHVVVEATDPALLEELKQLKAGADPAQGTATIPEALKNKRVDWRLVRIESDMTPINVAPQGPDGPGGPGGGPGG